MTNRSLHQVSAAALLVACTASLGCRTPDAVRGPEERAISRPVLRAAWLYPAPVGDAGWSYAHKFLVEGVEGTIPQQ